jgi:hypothetical protein
MEECAHTTGSAQAREAAIARARIALADTTDHIAHQRALVRLIAELASLRMPWPDIESTVRHFAQQHGVDVDEMLPRTRILLIAATERALATGRCTCWACRRLS